MRTQDSGRAPSASSWHQPFRGEEESADRLDASRLESARCGAGRLESATLGAPARWCACCFDKRKAATLNRLGCRCGSPPPIPGAHSPGDDETPPQVVAARCSLRSVTLPPPLATGPPWREGALGPVARAAVARCAALSLPST